MGLTIVQRSERRACGRRSRVALVLAGGSLTGAAYELGGLRALEDVLADFRAVDFDLYVGVSAGAYIAAPLAGGISPQRMLGTLDGASPEFARAPDLGLLDLNAGALLRAPFAYLRDVVRTVLHGGRRVPRPLAYLPAGLFSNASLERYLRENLPRGGAPNDFARLRRERGVALYIVATDLNTAERVVFGHDENASVTIAQAVQASTALPGVYKPARLGGVDYVDGAVHRTADLDVAIGHGADLVVCYNPLRPLAPAASRGSRSASLADRGLGTAFNQVFRTLIHARLHLQLQHLRHDPDFHGDVVLIEPPAHDVGLFDLGSFGVDAARAAADYGYRSVRQTVARHFARLRGVLARHGLVLRAPATDPAAAGAVPARRAG